MMNIKDPDANLDYAWDWTSWLPDGDTITSHQVTVPDGLTLGTTTLTGAIVTAWISGGTPGELYTVTCRITTSDGRTDDRSRTIKVEQR